MQKKPGYVAIKSVDLNKLKKKGLHHPHIVALIDCQETTAHIHLVMEFCELGDLSYFIKKRDTLSRHEATRDMIEKYPNPVAGGLNEVIVRHFLKQLASALEFLRTRNYIHRDVKPQNLLLDPSPLLRSRSQTLDSHGPCRQRRWQKPSAAHRCTWLRRFYDMRNMMRRRICGRLVRFCTR